MAVGIASRVYIVIRQRALWDRRTEHKVAIDWISTVRLSGCLDAFSERVCEARCIKFSASAGAKCSSESAGQII